MSRKIILNFQYDPHELTRGLLISIYEYNINQFKDSHIDMIKFKYKMSDWLHRYLSNEILDSITAPLADKNGVVHLNSANEFKQKLWLNMLKNQDFGKYFTKSSSFTCSAYDKHTKTECVCNIGYHADAIAVLLEKADMLNKSVEEQDSYVSENIELHSSKNKPYYLNIKVTQSERVYIVDPIQFMMDYMKNHWMETY